MCAATRATRAISGRAHPATVLCRRASPHLGVGGTRIVSRGHFLIFVALSSVHIESMTLFWDVRGRGNSTVTVFSLLFARRKNTKTKTLRPETKRPSRRRGTMLVARALSLIRHKYTSLTASHSASSLQSIWRAAAHARSRTTLARPNRPLIDAPLTAVPPPQLAGQGRRAWPARQARGCAARAAR